MGLSDKISEFFNKAEKEVKVIKGEETKDKLYSSSKTYDSEKLASSAFLDAKQKLFEVNKWSSIPSPLNATFELYSASGNPYSSARPSIGDYLRIDLPGPLPDYWVKVIEIKDEESFAEFTVRPSEDPTAGESSAETQHFFTKEATSTFKVEREGLTLKAFEIGKNETVNSDTKEAGSQAPLNAIVAEGGWAGVQEIQWKNLTEYLVGTK